jgi:hypothetical protein
MKNQHFSSILYVDYNVICEKKLKNLYSGLDIYRNFDIIILGGINHDR